MNNESGTLNGQVVNALGNPISEVTVSIVRSPEPVPDIAAITNSNGEFSFSYLEDGNYQLRFIKNDSDVLQSLDFNAEQKLVVFKIED